MDKGQCQGALKIPNVYPPLHIFFGDLNPSIPVSTTSLLGCVAVTWLPMTHRCSDIVSSPWRPPRCVARLKRWLLTWSPLQSGDVSLGKQERDLHQLTRIYRSLMLKGMQSLLLRVTCLQNEVGTKDLCESRNFSWKLLAGVATTISRYWLSAAMLTR